jgi:hypothetical protein
MPFFGGSFYGWGVFRISVPRSSSDIYADRRTRKLIHDGPERRRGLFFSSFPGIWIGLMRRDFPAGRVLTVGFLSLTSIVLLSLTSLLVPRAMEEDTSPSVEIVARLLEEPMSPPPIEVASVPPPAIREKPAPPSEPVRSLPEPKRHPIRVVPLEKPPESSLPEKVVALQTVKAAEVQLPTPKIAQRYDLPQSTPLALPEQLDRSMASRTDPRIHQPVAASSRHKDYRLDTEIDHRGSLPRGRSFSPTAAGTTIDLPAATGLKKHTGRPRSQGDDSAPVTGRAFSPQGPAEEVIIGRVGPTGNAYRVAAAANEPGGPVPVPEKNQVGGLGRPSTGIPLDIPDPSGRELSRSAGLSRGPTTTATMPDSSIHSISEARGGEYDPSLLVSLNQLRACIDQSEEDRLRTELAILLERDGQCRSGAMIFFFKFPETGWTMQLDLYNPVEFADKCAALAAAIDCIHHPK